MVGDLLVDDAIGALVVDNSVDDAFVDAPKEVRSDDTVVDIDVDVDDVSYDDDSIVLSVVVNVGGVIDSIVVADIVVNVVVSVGAVVDVVEGVLYVYTGTAFSYSVNLNR